MELREKWVSCFWAKASGERYEGGYVLGDEDGVGPGCGFVEAEGREGGVGVAAYAYGRGVLGLVGAV